MQYLYKYNRSKKSINLKAHYINKNNEIYIILYLR